MPSPTRLVHRHDQVRHLEVRGHQAKLIVIRQDAHDLASELAELLALQQVIEAVRRAAHEERGRAAVAQAST